MERKADMAHGAPGQLFLHEFKCMQLLRKGVCSFIQRMQQVVVNISHAQALKRFGKDGFQLVLLPDLKHGHFICDGKGSTRITLHYRFTEGRLTGAAMIYIRCVEIGEACSDKAVHHGLHGSKVDVRRIARRIQRQAHQAKAQFFHSASSFSGHGRLLSQL